MVRNARPTAWMIATLGCLMAPLAAAQEQPTGEQGGQAAQQPATAPAGSAERQPIMARVIEVIGDVKHAPLDSQDWQPVKLEDEYPEGTKILAGVHSSVKFQIGDEEPYTCMLVDSAGLTILSEAAIERNTKKVRVGVGYGRIRAGVAEGGLESQFTVDSPVATLSKRGTWGFQLYYERDTDIFEIALAQRGLVEAIQRIMGQSRSVQPGERVTQAMRMWLDQAQMDRNVSVPDILGQEDIEVAFNRLQNDGLGVLGPGQGRAVLINLENPNARVDFVRRIERILGPPGLITPPRVNRVRPEGFFGTGRGDELVDVLIEASDPLAQRGYARPGTYRFRRSVLEGWLRRNRPD